MSTFSLLLTAVNQMENKNFYFSSQIPNKYNFGNLSIWAIKFLSF